MKSLIIKVSLTTLLFGLSVVVFSQQEKDSIVETEIYQVVEEEPQFPGGDEARIKFIIDNIVYPKEARETGVQGTIVVGFVVETDGSLSNFRVLRGKHPALDEEALRVIKLMPNWIPAKHRGKPIRVQFQMPITFSLTK